MVLLISHGQEGQQDTVGGGLAHNKMDWVGILPLPLTSCVTLIKLHNFSESVFLICRAGTCLAKVWRKVNQKTRGCSVNGNHHHFCGQELGWEGCEQHKLLPRLLPLRRTGTHLSCSCSQRDPVKMCVKSCHSSAQSPQGALTQGQSQSLHRRLRALHGLPCPFLSVLICYEPHPPLLHGHSVAPERPGTLLPWGLGIAVPSAWNLFSSDICLLRLFLLLPVFAQMPSCRQGLLGHSVFTFYFCFSLLYLFIYVFMYGCIGSLLQPEESFIAGSQALLWGVQVSLWYLCLGLVAPMYMKF